MQRLKDKIILISGASSGIGEATAKALAAESAHLILLARNEENLQQVSQSITKEGGKANYFVCDISDYNQVIEVSEKIKQEIGIPDILINNAGYGKWKFIEETSYHEVSQYMAVPYFGAFYLTKAFLTEMKKRNSGQIVNMTSYAGITAFAGATAYIVARKAMIGFHEALSADLYHTKIKCSLAYFAKVKSSYWSNNQGSEERLPEAQVLIPSITPEKAAQAILKGILKKKKYIYTPFMISVINFMVRFTPRISRLLILKTGYYQK